MPPKKRPSAVIKASAKGRAHLGWVLEAWIPYDSTCPKCEELDSKHPAVHYSDSKTFKNLIELGVDLMVPSFSGRPKGKSPKAPEVRLIDLFSA